MSGKLTAMQARFVAAYDGNGVAAARKAGAKGSDGSVAATASRWLKMAKVADAIAKREQKRQNPAIADREERQAFWTAVMRGEHAGEGADWKDRIKASELLGKSEGDFLDRVDHSSKDGSMSPPSAVTFIPHGSR